MSLLHPKHPIHSFSHPAWILTFLLVMIITVFAASYTAADEWKFLTEGVSSTATVFIAGGMWLAEKYAQSYLKKRAGLEDDDAADG